MNKEGKVRELVRDIAWVLGLTIICIAIANWVSTVSHSVASHDKENELLKERIKYLEEYLTEAELQEVEHRINRDKIGSNSFAEKPVIYLYNYPERVLCGILGREIKEDDIWFMDEGLSVNVRINIKSGEITTTYPKYDRIDGWNVEVFPDGRVIDMQDGLEYNYLYWEAELNADYDMTKGFCVKKEDSAKFLREALAKLGLTPREYNEFIVYWLPRLEENEYNLITFQTSKYTNNASLNIVPKPDNMIRIFMVYKGLDSKIEITEQDLESLSGKFERKGFTIVEWGGTEIKTEKTR